MSTSDMIAAGALVISLLAIIISVVEKNRAQQESIIKALQGEKESVAYVALQTRNRKWYWKKDRKDIITALTMAWVYESSDRSRAILLAALKEAKREDVQASWLELKQLFDNYKHDVLEPEQKQADLEKHYIRLAELQKALQLHS